MRIEYDPQVDAAHISFERGPVQATTVRITEDVAIDLGPGEEIVGVLILDASENLGFASETPRIQLENLEAMA